MAAQARQSLAPLLASRLHIDLAREADQTQKLIIWFGHGSPRYDAAMAKVVLQLHIRPAPGRREDLLDLLRRARAFYESPGGIQMRLLASREDADALIEVFEYESVQAYEADALRVEQDEQMKAWLAQWRSLLEGPPRVEVFDELAV